MELRDVIEIVGHLGASGVTVWVDGGWCVAALVGREVRKHADLDLAVRPSEELLLHDWQASHEFSEERLTGDSQTEYTPTVHTGSRR